MGVDLRYLVGRKVESLLLLLLQRQHHISDLFMHIYSDHSDDQLDKQTRKGGVLPQTSIPFLLYIHLPSQQKLENVP
mgnify:CR=1 FL=1